jgi:C1A family cysteine protease
VLSEDEFEDLFDEYLTEEKLRKKRFYPEPSYTNQKTKPKRMNLLGVNIPTRLDWRKRAKTQGRDFTPVKDQLSCNACYAFSAMSALETHIVLKGGQQM